MSIHLPVIAALSLCLASTTVSAEQLQLRSGTLNAPTLATAETGQRLLELAARPDASHLVIRLHAEADAEERRNLKSRGIELLSCLGPRTRTARTEHPDNLDMAQFMLSVDYIEAVVRKLWTA